MLEGEEGVVEEETARTKEPPIEGPEAKAAVTEALEELATASKIVLGFFLLFL